MKLLALSAVLLLAGASHAQVFKCQQGDTTVYSDAPCGARPEVLDRDRLEGNTTQRDPAHRVPTRQAPVVAPPLAENRVPANCPSEQDIRNMETSLSSITLRGKPRERAFLESEVRRARACSKEGGNYTAEDWQRLKDAQAAQNNLSRDDRRRERGIAEGIHAPSVSEREHERMPAERLGRDRTVCRQVGTRIVCD
jgi:hypothetical protein